MTLYHISSVKLCSTFHNFLVCRMTFGRMTFGTITFGRITFGMMTFDRMTFGRMTFGRMTFGRTTFSQTAAELEPMFLFSLKLLPETLSFQEEFNEIFS